MQAERVLERRIVSVLFCDLVGFTSLSEELDAEDVVTIQDAYFGLVHETVARYGGVLEKFVGDAAVAVFGVPRLRDDDAERAVRAGLALATGVDQLGPRLGLETSELRLRVGVNTGEVVYGSATPERGPVTGDAVNVAARLQAQARPGGVLVGEDTALAVSQAIELENAGALELKGKAIPVRAWHAVRARPEPSRELAMGGLRAPTLGRDDELAWLERVVDAPPARAASVLVVAPPGVGKTRLVDELARRVERRAAVVRARLQPDVLAPYDAVAQLLLAALMSAGLAPGELTTDAAAAVLADRLAASGTTPARAEVVSGAALGVLWPGAEEKRSGQATDREAVFAAWLEAFGALGAGRAALWIVEDAHWAGGDLLAFLVRAGAQPTSPPAVVVTARPVLLERLGSELRFGEVRELAPLSETDTNALIRALVGEALPEGLRERVAAASDGNPLFIEELLRSWASTSLLVHDGSGWRLDADGAEIAVPTTVHVIYAAQLDDLPEHARLAARRASVPGRRFPEAALEPLGVSAPGEALAALARRAFVAGPGADALLGTTWAFRHALLRDAGYATLTRAERAQLHVRYARWLEAVTAERPIQLAELIGRHYAAAVESAPRLAAEIAPGLSRAEAAVAAANWLEHAADGALDVGAHEAAHSLFARSLELTDEEAVADVLRRRRKLGEATAVSADMDEAAVELERARALARTALGGSDEALLELVRGEYSTATASLGWVYNQQVRFDDARRLADEALSVLGESDDLETARLLLLRATAVGFGTDEVDRPLLDLRRAIRLAGSAGSPEVELEALLLQTRWDDESTADDLRRLRQLALTRGRWAVAVGAMRSEAMEIAERDAAAAFAVLSEAEELARARGLIEELAWIGYVRTELGLLTGDWDTALLAGIEAAGLAERNSYRRAGIRTWYAVLAIASARRDEDLLRRGHAFCERFRPHFPEVPAPWARVMSTAADLSFGWIGLPRTVRYEPEDAAAVPAFGDVHQLPSFWEAAGVLFDSWLRRGDAELVARALDVHARARERANAPPPSGMWADAIFGARLTGATGGTPDVEALYAAAASARAVPAPAWTVRSLRELETAGAASVEEVAEAAELERRLGIAR